MRHRLYWKNTGDSVFGDEEIVFMPDISKKWEKAFSKIGVNIDTLSGYSGSA